MNVLILGSGGREHALAWKIAQSDKLDKLFIGPGNAGTAQLGTNVKLNPEDFKAVKEFVLENDIQIMVVGPEAPLVAGIHDYFQQDPALSGIYVIGPTKRAAMLEGSKDFAKAFMMKHGIPTAGYRTFTDENVEEGIAYLDTLKPPIVLKADGLAAGKGVLILETLEEAKAELQSMLADQKFGKASEKVVIEDFLSGIELSVFVLADGNSYILLPEAKDYKRIGEGDTGKNTGGMGSISPVPFATPEFMDKVKENIIEPTIHGLQSDGITYKGFIFFGLINVGGEPFVIEYNARMGDPEAESILPRIKSDLLDLFIAVGEESLSSRSIEFDPRYSASIMAVSGGYPGSYEKDKPIEGLEQVEESIVFHAGTKPVEGQAPVTNGGRVLAVTTLDNNLENALKSSYKELRKIKFDKIYYRNDLGQDLMKFL
jgi:phosphoribosylamine--glycine ligase